ncbi:MAG TPA: hypothetical protein PLE21_00355 [Giesbergeria sp.]|nr:hypothetical protein [Giesbergeria sp.]
MDAHLIAAYLRSQHAELETLREKLKTYEDLGDAGIDVQLLRMGYAAARLEIESLKAQLVERASHGQAPAQAAPAAVAGCTRSHPHENMDSSCRAKAAIAEMRNRAARGAEATAQDLERFVRMIAAAPSTTAQPAPQPSPASQGDALDAAFEAVRKRLCKLPRYSFALDSRSNLRRCEDRSGNWIEFDAVHALFDPVAIDAARAAQEGK